MGSPATLGGSAYALAAVEEPAHAVDQGPHADLAGPQSASPARHARHRIRSLHVNACDAWRRHSRRPAPWAALTVDCRRPVRLPEHRGVALDHVLAWLSQRGRRGSGLALDACQALDDHDDTALLATAILDDDHRVIRNVLQAALLVQGPTWAYDLATGDVGRRTGTSRTTR